MAQTLDSFMQEQREKVEAFEKWWRWKHTQEPEHFPLEMAGGNEGLWWEMLHEFDVSWLNEIGIN